MFNVNKELVKVPISNNINEIVEEEPVKDVYITDNINDENSSILTESNNTVSYWYVYYNVHRAKPENFWTGYDVVELSTPYFDISSAIIIIFPQYTDEDFVGIEYFKRVPIETYKLHKEAESKKD